MYQLLDCIRVNEQNKSFLIPSAEQLNQIKVGSVVQLFFTYPELKKENKSIPSELMWVLITEMVDNQLTGELVTNPVFNAIRKSEIVVFEKKNICKV